MKNKLIEIKLRISSNQIVSGEILRAVFIREGFSLENIVETAEGGHS